MFGLDNIDLKKDYSSLKDEVKSLKSYVWQMVEELKFRLDDSTLYGAEEDTISELSEKAAKAEEALDAKVEKNTITIKEAEGSGVTVASQTATKVAALSLPAGTWVVIAHCTFDANTSGYRAACINTSAAWNEKDAVLASAPPTQGAKLCTASVRAHTQTTTYYLVVYQNSGSSLSAGGWLQAVRLK